MNGLVVWGRLALLAVSTYAPIYDKLTAPIE